MSLAVVSAGGTSAANVSTNLLADLNLTNAQSVQIEQILAELQTGVISPVEARAQIAGIVTSTQTPSSPAGQSTSAGAGSGVASPPVEPLQSYYELPLPQESLKGTLASYTSLGAATQTVFSGSQSVNAQA